MKVKVCYTVTVDDDYRRAVADHYGREGLASRAEVRAWLIRYGESMDDDLARDAEDRDAA